MSRVVSCLAMHLPPRQRRQLYELMRHGPLSRTALIERLGLRRNTVYADVTSLLMQGLVEEIGPTSSGVGRPRVPLQIDAASRSILGLSFQSGKIEIGRFTPLGQPTNRTQTHTVSQSQAITMAADLIAQHRDKQTTAIGVSVPGLIDRDRDEVAFSVAFAGSAPMSLQPIQNAARNLPVIIDTEAHAVAARWILQRGATPSGDTLLIYCDDGTLGAAFIVGGHPNRGCISGGNELGHTRLPVRTARCYCGAIGCLERLCDSRDLCAHGLPVDFAQALARGMIDHRAMTRMIGLLAIGFANAINFTRAAQVVVASQMAHSGPLLERIIDATREQLLPQLRDRVSLNTWPDADPRSAHTAACLGMTALYLEDWSSV